MNPQFKENTMKYSNDVKFLIKQYKTGPVTNASDIKKPYLEYLNEKLQEDIDNFNRIAKEANEKYDAWVSTVNLTNYNPHPMGIDRLGPTYSKKLPESLSVSHSLASLVGSSWVSRPRRPLISGKRTRT